MSKKQVANRSVLKYIVNSFSYFILISLIFIGQYLQQVDVRADNYGTNKYSECKYSNYYCNMYLSMNFRNAADTLNVSQCNLGTASDTSVSTCQYRVKIDTNAKDGYSLYVKSSGGFTNSSNTIPSASVGSGGSGGTDISNSTAGVEMYGVVIDKGAITGTDAPGVPTLSSIFDAGTNAVKYDYTTNQLLLLSIDINRPSSIDLINTSLVTHKLNIETLTNPGTYQQVITYTLLPNF